MKHYGLLCANFRHRQIVLKMRKPLYTLNTFRDNIVNIKLECRLDFVYYMKQSLLISNNDIPICLEHYVSELCITLGLCICTRGVIHSMSVRA